MVPPEHLGNLARVLELFCTTLLDLLAKEPRVVDVKGPVYVMGDIHGMWCVGAHAPVCVVC